MQIHWMSIPKGSINSGLFPRCSVAWGILSKRYTHRWDYILNQAMYSARCTSSLLESWELAIVIVCMRVTWNISLLSQLIKRCSLLSLSNTLGDLSAQHQAPGVIFPLPHDLFSWRTVDTDTGKFSLSVQLWWCRRIISSFGMSLRESLPSP